MTSPNVCLTDGSPVTPDHREINPETGMQKGYVVLTEEEREKGFIRPVRCSYVHVGIRPKYPMQELTEHQKEMFPDEGYVAFEPYTDSEYPRKGKFWTEKELNSGCGGLTTMHLSLAETYARDPSFYGSTFCCSCGTHLKVREFVWSGTDKRVGS